MSLNGSLKVKMEAIGAGTTGHGLMMIAIEAVVVMGDVDDMCVWINFFWAFIGMYIGSFEEQPEL